MLQTVAKRGFILHYVDSSYMNKSNASKGLSDYKLPVCLLYDGDDEPTPLMDCLPNSMLLKYYYSEAIENYGFVHSSCPSSLHSGSRQV